MSYCRFSSDDFQSDVYCYRTDDKFVTHVAAVKIVAREPLPTPILETSDNGEEVDAREDEVMRIISQSKNVPIGLPHDGAYFTDDSAHDCIARLRGLRAAGYRVPEKAITRLESEIVGDTE